MKLLRTITVEKKIKLPTPKKVINHGKLRRSPSSQYIDNAICGSVIIHDKLDILKQDVHKDVHNLLDASLVKDYKEFSGGVLIKYTDKSSLEIRFGANKVHQYKYIVNKQVVFDDKA